MVTYSIICQKTIGDIKTSTNLIGDFKCTTKTKLEVEVQRDYGEGLVDGWFLEYYKNDVKFLLVLCSGVSRKLNLGPRLKWRLITIDRLMNYGQNKAIMKKYPDRIYFEYDFSVSTDHIFLGDFTEIQPGKFDTDTFRYGPGGKIKIFQDVKALGL